MSLTWVIVGIVIVAAGIIMNHFIANRYWIILIIIGAIIAIVGMIYMLVPGVGSLDFILPYANSSPRLMAS